MKIRLAIDPKYSIYLKLVRKAAQAWYDRAYDHNDPFGRKQSSRQNLWARTMSELREAHSK